MIIVSIMLLWGLAVLAMSTDSLRHEPQSVGLVLSGGGAKGIAHIGVIQALEDNNIPIDYITGTSMGAIVGSLYACGYTPREMMELITSADFANWSTGTVDPRQTYYFLKDDPSPAILSLNIGSRDSTLWKSVLPTSLINPLPMNLAFMELYAPYTTQCGGDFNKLFVPFRAVASDMTAKRRVVWADGSLGNAVRSSMSFPLVFHPLKLDGHLLYDGGIYDNFPVDVMSQSFAPEIMIGVDVAASPQQDETNSMVNQLETMIMQHTDYSMPADRGIKLRIHLEQFSLLDFAKARQIYQIGYDKALEMMDSIKMRIHSRIPHEARELRRDVFKSQTPALVFDSVAVDGGTDAQQNYLLRLFGDNRRGALTMADVTDAYYRAIAGGRFSNLMPKAVYDEAKHSYTLKLHQDVKSRLNLGVGGYFTTATNSMLYLGLGYKALGRRTTDFKFSGWLGQSYLASAITARIGLGSALTSCLKLSAGISRNKYFRKDRMFFQTNQPTALTTDEYLGMASYVHALGRNGVWELQTGFVRKENHYYPITGAVRQIFNENLGRSAFKYDFNTLDNVQYPTSGSRVEVTATAAYGRHISKYNGDAEGVRSNRHWLQGELQAQHFLGLSSKISLGGEVTLLMSTRKLLPSYVATIIDAPAYVPTPSYSNLLSESLRSYNYAAVGLVPVWRVGSMLQLRGKIDCFLPMRSIVAQPDGSAKFGRWWGNPEFFGQVEGVVSLKVANVSAYAHYCTVAEGRWNFGLSLGVFLQGPK